MKRYPKYKDSGVERVGEVPEGWKVLPLKRFAPLTYGDALASDLRDDAGSVLVYGSNGPVGLHHVGNTCGPTILIGRKGSFGALNWSDTDAFAIDTVYFVDRRSAKCDLRWLYWTLHIANFDSLSQDTGIPGLSRSKAHSTLLPIPSISEQRAIADFLDRETARIDQLIEKKEALRAYLPEKEKAEITRLVLYGDDPEVHFQDSGIGWRGKIPNHWRETRIKAHFRIQKRQGYSDLTVLSVYREFGVIEKASRDDNINKTPDDLSKYQLVEPGDLVINKMKSWQGSLGISLNIGITSPDYVVMKPIMDHHPAYIHHLLRARPMPTIYHLISNGIRPDQWRMEPEKFLGLPIFLPPKSEQERIALRIDQELAQLRNLDAKIDQSLDRLREFRSALITAAVTGRIDVSDWRKQERVERRLDDLEARS